MPDPKKLLGSFFGNLIQGIGKKKYQDFMRAEQDRLGEKQIKAQQQSQYMDTALENSLNTDLPWSERVQWMDIYKKGTGNELPTIWPSGGGTQTQTPGIQAQQPTGVYDIFDTGTVGQRQDFLQGAAERQKTLAGADAQKALAESRRADATATAKGKTGDGKVDTAAEKLKLDQLKTQFNQLNAQYDDLAKLIPRDIYGNPTVDAKDPRLQSLQDIDRERNRVYQKMYGGEKKTIPGF